MVYDLGSRVWVQGLWLQVLRPLNVLKGFRTQPDSAIEVTMVTIASIVLPFLGYLIGF